MPGGDRSGGDLRGIDYFYDVPLPNVHSATIQILKTGRALAELGHDFGFLSRGSASDTSSVLADLALAPHPRLHFGNGFPSRPLTPVLRRIAIATRPPRALSHVPSHGPERVIVSRGETGLLLAPVLRRAGRTFLYEMHRLAFVAEAERLLGRRLLPDETLPPGAERVRRREARTIAAADALIFLTDELRAATAMAFDVSVPTVVAPSGVDLPPSLQTPKDVDLIYVGKIEPRKGVDTALAALRHLPGRRLRLVGGGERLQWARDRARALGVEDRVEFTGHRPHAQITAELSRARVGLCPLPEGIDHVSARFTSPLKLLEMMAAGLPIVATDLPSVRAICRHGDQALLVAPDSPFALAQAAERLLTDPGQAVPLGARARRHAASFEWSERAQKIAGLIGALDR